MDTQRKVQSLPPHTLPVVTVRVGSIDLFRFKGLSQCRLVVEKTTGFYVSFKNKSNREIFYLLGCRTDNYRTEWNKSRAEKIGIF